MSLVRMALGHYRCFAQRQDIELRPVTVVLGRNNSGKSALAVPYPQQLMLLAFFFHHRPDPDGAHSRALVRWFWSTSWSTVVIGNNAFQLRRVLHRMRAHATGRAGLSSQGSTLNRCPNASTPKTVGYAPSCSGS